MYINVGASFVLGTLITRVGVRWTPRDFFVAGSAVLCCDKKIDHILICCYIKHAMTVMKSLHH